jgi:hypothetical protein
LEPLAGAWCAKPGALFHVREFGPHLLDEIEPERSGLLVRRLQDDGFAISTRAAAKKADMVRLTAAIKRR